ncbi:hypothetical protein G7054_g14509 [Neopestalotiopsis clavispora]|nr:hypothetical protein G7054_g14509 [Neopestalotiopsis clavispora]
MALISAKTILTSLCLFHITLGYFFFTSPRSIADQALVYILGEAMGMLTTCISFQHIAPDNRLQHADAHDLAPRPPPPHLWPVRHSDPLPPRGDLARAPLGRASAPPGPALLGPDRRHFSHDAPRQPPGLGAPGAPPGPRQLPGRGRLGRAAQSRLLHTCLCRNDELVLGLGHAARRDEELCREKEEEKLDSLENLRLLVFHPCVHIRRTLSFIQKKNRSNNEESSSVDFE